MQEEFDARLHPHGWDMVNFTQNRNWCYAMPLECGSDKPSVISNYSDYIFESGCENPDKLFLRKRQITPVKETKVNYEKLVDAFYLEWIKNPLDWFEFRNPDCYKVLEQNADVTQKINGRIEIRPLILDNAIKTNEEKNQEHQMQNKTTLQFV